MSENNYACIIECCTVIDQQEEIEHTEVCSGIDCNESTLLISTVLCFIAPGLIFGFWLVDQLYQLYSVTHFSP